MADEKEKELNLDELGEVTGGFAGMPNPFSYPPYPPFPPIPPQPQPVRQAPPQRVGTCNKCAEMGYMNNNLYRIPGTSTTFCLDEGHFFINDAYDHCDKDAAKALFGY